MHRHAFVGVATLTLGALGLFAAAALAQPYPSKPIRIIVPFPAGGGVDFIGRIAGRGMSERLGQQVVIDNRAGANAIVGLEVLKSSPPDGYTIAAASAGPLAVNPFIYRKLPHDTLEGLHADRQHGEFPAAHGHPPIAAGEEREGAHRARAVAAGRNLVCLARGRKLVASRGRAVQRDGEGRHPPRPVQGNGAGGHIHGVRRSTDHLRQHPADPAARALGPGPGARRRKRPARPIAAGVPDDIASPACRDTRPTRGPA